MPTPLDAIEVELTDDREVERTGSVPRWLRASLSERPGADGARAEG